MAAPMRSRSTTGSACSRCAYEAMKKRFQGLIFHHRRAQESKAIQREEDTFSAVGGTSADSGKPIRATMALNLGSS